jgi:Domain of unknown function (DUF4383)
MDSRTRTPAQLYAIVIGVVLILAGVIGFFYSAAFGTPGKVSPVVGILDVNGWHNVVHLASGGYCWRWPATRRCRARCALPSAACTSWCSSWAW